MHFDNQSSSNNSTDSLSFDFHNMCDLSKSPGLKLEWEAIEQTLYREDFLETFPLPSNILHECKIWRELFPYLRVRGRRIDNPLNQKMLQIKHQIITVVVDKLVEKIADEGVKVYNGKGQRLVAPKKESYFERGKTKITQTLNGPDTVKNASITHSISVAEFSKIQTKPQPRSILKKSSSKDHCGDKVKQQIKGDAVPHNTFACPSLPRISSNNNWLTRSERRCSETLHSGRSQTNERKKVRNPCTKETLILPPITPKFNLQ